MGIVLLPLQININGKPFTIAMRTPGHDLDLTRGLLFTEGVIKDNDEIENIEELFHAGVTIPFAVTVRIDHFDENEFMRTGISSSSCGLCGKKEWKDKPFVQDKANASLIVLNFLSD